MGSKFGIVSRWPLCACTCMVVLATAFVGNGQVAGAAAGGSAIDIQIDVPYNLPVASQPESIAAAQAAVDAINKNGGVNGHKLSLSVCNTDLNPSSSWLALPRRSAAMSPRLWVTLTFLLTRKTSRY